MTYLVTFRSHFDAILTNRALKSAGVDVRLMPVPRSLSSSCGTCVVFPLAPGQPIPDRVEPPVEVEHVYRQRGPDLELIQ